MQPYQKASEEIKRQGELPLKALSAGAAAGSIFGGISLGRILPFLSQYIPQQLAIKGLSKIDPRFGTFINTALGEGSSFDEIKKFIKGKAEGENSQDQQQTTAQSPQQPNPNSSSQAQQTLHETPRNNLNSPVYDIPPSQSQSPQQSSSGDSDQALLAALQKILQM